MSASTEKKIRAQARENGTDKKTLEAQEEEKKQKKIKTWTIVGVIGVVLLIALVLVLNSDLLYRATTALKVSDQDFSTADVNYYYASEYQSVVSTYGDYVSLIGLDTTYGITGLDAQTCALAEEEGTSWRTYLLGLTEDQLKQYYVLNKYAKEQGITLTDEELASIDEQIAEFDTYAETYGYSSGEKMISAMYGKGVNKEVLRNALIYETLAQNAYTQYYDSVTVTNEEIDEQYPSKAVRHILIKAEADENGEYTDEAKEAAKAKAEEIYEEWKNGDATEESFAKLAEKYSEDEGSNTDGGLYANVTEGSTVTEFNNFIFDASRKSGDTGIVYGESSSYAGYHVMYYVGDGDPETNTTAQSTIKSTRTTEWISGQVGDVTVEECYWIRLVGKN